MKRMFSSSLLFVIFLALACSPENPYPPGLDQAMPGANLAKKAKPASGPKSDAQGACPDLYFKSSKVLRNSAVVTWTSSFVGYDYKMSDPYQVIVDWQVENGTATFARFSGKKKVWTPPKDVGGTWEFDETSGCLTVTLSEMHRSVKSGWAGYIGNGHFKLELNVANANGTVKAKFGVNVHLEDPDSQTRCVEPGS